MCVEFLSAACHALKIPNKPDGYLSPAVVPCQEPTLFANLKTLKLMYEHFHTHYRLQDLMDHNIMNTSQRGHSSGGDI